MKKLTRNWRRKDARFSLPTRDDDSHPIDSQEQEDFVRSLEREHALQSRLWRTVFAAFLFCYALFLLYLIFQQATSPWEMRHHAYFMEDIRSWMIIAADFVAVSVSGMAIVGLCHNSTTHRQWIWYSFSTGLVLAVFWIYYLLRLPRFRWDAIWLPLGPLSGAGLSLYIDHLLSESSEEVRKLRSYMYAYKSI